VNAERDVNARELDNLIPAEQLERLERFRVSQLVQRELGCYVTFEEVVEIVRAAKAEEIESIKASGARTVTLSAGPPAA
jgi:hypothetical protein